MDPYPGELDRRLTDRFLSAPPTAWYSDVRIPKAAADLLWHGLAPTTRSRIRTAVRRYTNYTAARGRTAFPASLETVCSWFTELVEETSVATAEGYLSSIRSHCIDLGLPIHAFHDDRLKRIIRGARRKYGTKKSPERKDITKDILSTITTYLMDTYDDINLKAAFCTAFAGFLRMGEFTWSAWTATSHLTQVSRGSVEFISNNTIILHLPSSKTDPFRTGTTIPIAAANDATCPVAMLRLLFIRYPKPRNAPLFSNSQNSFNYSWVIRRLSTLLLQAGLNPKGYSGHYFRRGAANTASQAGIATADIMKMGRWKSDAINRYFSYDTTNEKLLTLSKQLHLPPGPPTSISSPDSVRHPPRI